MKAIYIRGQRLLVNEHGPSSRQAARNRARKLRDIISTLALSPFFDSMPVRERLELIFKHLAR